MTQIYVDILIVAFNEVRFDGRLNNFIHTLRKLEKTIAVISLDNEIDGLLHFPITLPKTRKLYKNLYEFVSKAKENIRKVIPKYVLCSDLYSLPIGAYFKKKKNSIVVYDSREIYSALGTLSNKPLKQLFLSYFESYYIKFVDKIIVTGELDKEILYPKFRNVEYLVIKNLPRKFQFDEEKNLKKDLNLSDENILLIYQGVLLKGRGLEQSIKALTYDNNLHLALIGDGQYKERLAELANMLELSSRVYFLGFIPYEKLLCYTKVADIGLCLVEPISLSYKLALPNKLFEYIQAKIPIVATKLPAIEQIFLNYRIGELVAPNETPENLAKIFINVHKNRHIYSKDLELASKIFIWENQTDTIKNLFR
ncbi:MAG: glycosyltransferase [Ignavibacteria bacterium]|nr:glycosyltransferase [Ignavibacteria bacterium]